MKICIYGAGAIGGYLGAKLTEIGADVTLIARGPHYQAIKQAVSYTHLTLPTIAGV